jgi:hypothetical protein
MSSEGTTCVCSSHNTRQKPLRLHTCTQVSYAGPQSLLASDWCRDWATGLRCKLALVFFNVYSQLFPSSNSLFIAPPANMFLCLMEQTWWGFAIWPVLWPPTKFLQCHIVSIARCTFTLYCFQLDKVLHCSLSFEQFLWGENTVASLGMGVQFIETPANQPRTVQRHVQESNHGLQMH